MTAKSRPRSLVAALAALLAAVLIGACGATPATPGPEDPYAILARSLDADYDPLQLQVGLKATGAGSDVTIPPDAIDITIDASKGTGRIAVSLTTDQLGIDPDDLGGLALLGNRIELELVVDAEAIYAKSPLAATLLPMLSLQSGMTIDGDLSGWLRLATMQDLEDLAAGMAPMPTASAAAPSPLADLDPLALKQQLEDAGVTVAFAGSESRNGVDARHVTVDVDVAKLARSELAEQLPADQLAQAGALASAGTIDTDLWFEAASGALSEAVVAVEAEGSGRFELTLLVSRPADAGIEVPTEYADVPLVEMFVPFLQVFGGSLVP